jgi:DNA-binding MarR family transcriptional regulator
LEFLEASEVRKGGAVDVERAERSARLFGLLALVVHRTSQDAAAILRREGLNPAQFQLLLAVRDHPGGSQRVFGEQFGVTGGNVSMLVSKLTASGLVRREARGAANRIWLTAAGTDLVNRLEPQQHAFMSDRFRGLTGDELAEMHRLAELTVRGLTPPS